MAQQSSKQAVPAKASTANPSVKTTADNRPAQFVFNKSNYTLFIASIAVVALGFVLMAGTTDIYSNTKIVLAPLVVLGGFALGFFAILKKPAPKA
jgi:type IV secretory pathway VirB2 component (pilin)